MQSTEHPKTLTPAGKEPPLIDPLMVSYIANTMLLLLVCGSPLLSIIALLQMRRRHTQGVELGLWVAVVLFVPILGAMAYFITSHQQQPRDVTIT